MNNIEYVDETVLDQSDARVSEAFLFGNNPSIDTKTHLFWMTKSNILYRVKGLMSLLSATD